MRTRCIKNSLLSSVPFIRNSPFAKRSLFLQPSSLTKDGDIMFGTQKGPIHPYEWIVKQWDCKLISKSSLIEFVRVKLSVFSQCWINYFVGTTMNAVDRVQKYWHSVVVSIFIGPFIWPYNLSRCNNVSVLLSMKHPTRAKFLPFELSTPESYGQTTMPTSLLPFRIVRNSLQDALL